MRAVKQRRRYILKQYDFSKTIRVEMTGGNVLCQCREETCMPQYKFVTAWSGAPLRMPNVIFVCSRQMPHGQLRRAEHCSNATWQDAGGTFVCPMKKRLVSSRIKNIVQAERVRGIRIMPLRVKTQAVAF